MPCQWKWAWSVYGMGSTLKLIWFWFCELLDCFLPPSPKGTGKLREERKGQEQSDDTSAHKGGRILFHLTRGDCITHKRIDRKLAVLHAHQYPPGRVGVFVSETPFSHLPSILSLRDRHAKLKLLVNFLGVNWGSLGPCPHARVWAAQTFSETGLLLSFWPHTLFP